jgi:hypothetical protein
MPAFPAPEEKIGPFTTSDQPFCEVISLIQLGRFPAGQPSGL